MSQNTAIVLDDSSAVSHTFTPISDINGVNTWRDGSATNLALAPYITGSLRQGSFGSNPLRTQRVKRRVIMKFVIPFQPSAVDGNTPAIDTLEAEVRYNIPLDALEDTISDLEAYVLSGLTMSPLNEMVFLGESPY